MERLRSIAQEYSSRPSRSRHVAFSLIEVTMSIGIISFAFLSIFSLIPLGLNSFRQTIDTGTASQIAQRVINDAQQSDFNDLTTDYTNNPITGAGATGVKPYRFFNDQGEEIVVSGTTAGNPAMAPTGMPASQKQQISYWVNTRITPATTVPNPGASVPDNASLATVTVQVAHNPGNHALALSGSTNLWSGAYSSAPGGNVVSIKSYNAFVARAK